MAEVGTLGAIVQDSYAPKITQYRMHFTTDGSTGAVSGIDKTIKSGLLLAAKIVPVTSGGTQPTSLFDVTLLDVDGLDLFGGKGANCVNTGPTLLQFDPALPFDGSKVQPTIANGGNSKEGDIVLIVGN